MVSKTQLANARVLVVGDAMLDRYWYGAVDRISPEAPVPVLRVTREEERIGAAANVAYNVVSLGAQASLLTVLGADEPGARLESLLRQTGITPIIGRDATLKTTVKLRLIGRNQQLLRADFENTPDHEALALMLGQFETALAAHDVVLFSDYGKGGLAHIVRMLELARAAGKLVLVDPKGRDYARYAGATLLTPNRAEFVEVAGAYASEAELQAKAQALRAELKLEALLVTRSEEGMSLFDAQGHAHVPTQAREVFDVTGAGDTVIGTLAALLACGVPMREAVVHANRAGGIVVGKLGTAVVSYDELFA
jgi:D-glycero-beta-D-manno-heptose-7-phosphate kinase